MGYINRRRGVGVWEEVAWADAHSHAHTYIHNTGIVQTGTKASTRKEIRWMKHFGKQHRSRVCSSSEAEEPVRKNGGKHMHRFGVVL